METHKKTLHGVSARTTAQELANLRYDGLQEILMELANALETSSIMEKANKRIKLAACLHKANQEIWIASKEVAAAWEICKRHVKH